MSGAVERQEGKIPKARARTVPASTLHVHPVGKVRPATQAERQEAGLEEIREMRRELRERFFTAINLTANTRYDVKEAKRHRENTSKAIYDVVGRVLQLEKDMKTVLAFIALQPTRAPEPFVASAASQAPRPRLAAPLPAWTEEARGVVERIKQELLPLMSISEISAFFGTSTGKIRNLTLTGKLKVIREVGTIHVSREALCQYVRIYGPPRPRKLFYGASREAHEESAT